MKRWLLVAVASFLLAPEVRSQDKAEKLFEAMETNLSKAKAQKLVFEINSRDHRGPLSLKGTLILANGNRLRLVFQGLNGDRPSKVTWVSDGKTMAIQTEIEGRTAKDARPAPDQLGEFLAGTLVRASLMSGINGAANRKLPDISALKPASFKMVGKEKIGDKDANVIAFQMLTPGAGNLMKCKVWLDPKTNLPLKRSLEVSRDGEELLRIAESDSEWELDPALAEDAFALPK
jgi:outer membrane lipoprotein-sorting protein